jgi:hypothetical protein
VLVVVGSGLWFSAVDADGSVAVASGILQLPLNAPGGKRSPTSLLLTPCPSTTPPENVYVVNGTISGWNTSVWKVSNGGASLGFATSKDREKRAVNDS